MHTSCVWALPRVKGFFRRAYLPTLKSVSVLLPIVSEKSVGIFPDLPAKCKSVFCGRSAFMASLDLQPLTRSLFFVHIALISGPLCLHRQPRRGRLFVQLRWILQDTLTDLFKYLAIARRARGDLPGAKEALARVERLGGSKGREDVEGLDRLMAENKISVG